MPKYRQEVINIRFADILRKMGFGAMGETITCGKLPDVMVEINGLKVNIEGWFEKRIKIADLKTKCRKRVEEGISDIAIGVLYPESLKEANNDEHLIEKIKQSNYKVFVFFPSVKEVKEQFLGELKIEQIAENLNYLYGEIIKTDVVKEQINKIEKAIQTCAQIVSKSSLFFSSLKVIEELKKALGIEEKMGLKEKTFREDLVKMALFIIFDGLLFHQILSSHHRNIKGLEKAPELNILNFIKEEWEKIMKINYLPIFTLAFKVVNSLPISLQTDEIFRNLKPVVLEIISSGVLLKHDLMGRVYHKLLLNTTGKYYASYYTSIPASILLSNLTIKTKNPDLNWNFENLENIKRLKIIDPACGSGTLLSGIYMALRDKYILDRYRSKDPEDLNLIEFHRLMMEKVLSGWDILDYAGHLTLTTLALHNPNSSFNRCNIYILPSGMVKSSDKKVGGIYLGSLSFLEIQPSQVLPMKELTPPIKEKGIKEEREIDFKPQPNTMDVIIMNPPFSRSAGVVNIKFGYVERDVMNIMNKKLSQLGKDLGFRKIGQAGLGAYFIILADKYLKQGGRLALVIPRAILSSVAWEEVRDKFLKDYEIEYIISNYDPGDKKIGIEPWNWSENTDLGEVLIVVRKTNKPLEKKYTTFVNLWNKPKNELESLIIVSDAIKARENKKLQFLEGYDYKILNLDDKEIGVIYNVSQKNLKKNFLIPCLFANPYLNKLVFDLTHNSFFQLVPLYSQIPGEKKSTGVDRKQILTTFKKVESKTPYRILWGYHSLMNTLKLDPTLIKYGKPKRKEPPIYIYAANLLIAETIHLSTQPLIAMYSDDKLLATLFWEIQMENDEAKILTLWLNSTFGFLVYLSHGMNNKADKFQIKKTQIKTLPVINIKRLGTAEKGKLLSLYEKLENISFHSFPEEFKLASRGQGARKEIDDEFIKILNLKIDLQPYYEMLAVEPIITLKRW